METLQIEIIEPRAKQLIDDLANLDLIRVTPMGNKAAFKKLLEKMRSSGSELPSEKEIADDVEAVRSHRVANGDGPLKPRVRPASATLGH
ncbi:MAG: hypothetical protein KF881_11195 [Acidobacteria bacterium]|nr:hypothetical protein [Acidobacteriota bacterium]